MNLQNVTKIVMPDGEVKAIHNSNGDLLWGKVSYDVKYKGDTAQNGTPTPSAPVAVQTVTGENVVKINDGQGNEQNYEVNLGKNLLSSLWESGSYDSSTGGKTPNGSMTRTANRISVNPNTAYIISVNGSGVAMNVYSYNAAGTFLGHQLVANSASFSTGPNTRYITMSRNANIDTSKAQLERGSIITQFAPYFTPIELCKIDNYQDYIYKSSGKWYVRKEIGKEIADGSEEWGQSSYTNTSILSAYSTGITAAVSGSFTYSDEFNYIATVSGSTTSEYVSHYNTNQLRIGILKSRLSSADITGFKAWLASNPATIYYVLATPTDTEITDEALVAQLDTIEQWLTRYGYNATVSGNLPIIIDRTAL